MRCRIVRSPWHSGSKPTTLSCPSKLIVLLLTRWAAHRQQPNASGCKCSSQRWSTITGNIQPQAVEYPTEITRSLVEEFTGKPFQYTEILPVFEDYVPDAKPWTVDVQTRALADMCLLLLNTNEFMYVY